MLQGDGGAEIRLRERERELELAREDARKATTEVESLRQKNREMQKEMGRSQSWLLCFSMVYLQLEDIFKCLLIPTSLCYMSCCYT